MKLKAIALLAAMAACQPVSVYPQDMKVIDTQSFGMNDLPLSSLTLFSEGLCEHIVFDNQLSAVPETTVHNLGGHYIMINSNSTEPDVISVTPAAGYYVDGPDKISVEDGSIGTIVVCLEAMS